MLIVIAEHLANVCAAYFIIVDIRVLQQLWFSCTITKLHENTDYMNALWIF